MDYKRQLLEVFGTVIRSLEQFKNEMHGLEHFPQYDESLLDSSWDIYRIREYKTLAPVEGLLSQLQQLKKQLIRCQGEDSARKIAFSAYQLSGDISEYHCFFCTSGDDYYYVVTGDGNDPRYPVLSRIAYFEHVTDAFDIVGDFYMGSNPYLDGITKGSEEP
jgi:hypothetical protein